MDGDPGTRAVLWDFDGTLAWREGLWRSALVTALDAVSPDHSVTAETIRPGLKGGFPWHRSEVEHHQLSNADLWWRELTPLLHGAYEQVGVDPATAALAAANVRAVYTDPAHWTVFPDTRESLTRIADAGFLNVVLSNHVPELPQLVVRLGLDDLVGEVITSASTGIEKPNRLAFELALRRAGSPATVWMVGDSPTADVAGATAAGIPALLVRTPDETGAVRTLSEAADVIIAAAPITPPRVPPTP